MRCRRGGDRLSLTSVTDSAEKGLSSAENLKGFIEIIIPLLIECWIEASPAQSAPILGNLLESESQQLMQQVLSIIHLLWKLTKRHDETYKMELWLRMNYLVDFKHHFMRHFPYSLQDTVKHKKKDPCKRSRSKVLSRWLAGLPQQLALLGLRNPELSNQLIDIIHSAASRSNKELLQSLQATAARIYDPLEGTLVLLPAEAQRRLVQLVYFLPCLPASLLACLSRCCIMGRMSSDLAATLIGILHMSESGQMLELSSLETFRFPSMDVLKTRLDTVQGDLPQVTPLEQDPWIRGIGGFVMLIFELEGKLVPLKACQDITIADGLINALMLCACASLEALVATLVICHSLSTIPSQSQCFDILQTGICKYLVGLVVIPDSTAGSVLCAINKLLDQACIISENLHRFLASCCYSLLYFLLTIDREDAEHLQKRDMLWRSCISALALLPRLLRLMLQSLQVSRICREELPVVAQLLRLLMQHGQLRSHMITNEFLVQQIIKDIMTLKSGEVQEQWLTDLHYCFNIYLASHPQTPGPINTVY
ncbi:hypothetical protein DUI87_07916 [Hirundo rustica rustica]|uniref:TEX10-like TPR repeats domain-containing protein n=1 Tax=Hirundo rustica rustica TaxID=333673 RepID=A0A3M0KRF1_HIRRU|nr:hypothetical protein DUI87_07916 [Hirundo rustica rustica]